MGSIGLTAFLHHGLEHLPRHVASGIDERGRAKRFEQFRQRRGRIARRVVKRRAVVGDQIADPERRR